MIMAQTIVQKVVFKNSTPAQLYNVYLDAKKHSAAIGAPVKISKRAGAAFTAHGRYIKGLNLQLVKDRMIVQSWRGSDWAKKELDSTLILQFCPQGSDTLLVMVHANVPEEHAFGIRKGWQEYYWKPWKKYLSMQKRRGQ